MPHQWGTGAVLGEKYQVQLNSTSTGHTFCWSDCRQLVCIVYWRQFFATVLTNTRTETFAEPSDNWESVQTSRRQTCRTSLSDTTVGQTLDCLEWRREHWLQFCGSHRIWSQSGTYVWTACRWCAPSARRRSHLAHRRRVHPPPCWLPCSSPCVVVAEKLHHGMLLTEIATFIGSDQVT